MNPGYKTEAQRVAARRETWRRSKEKRYAHYKELCCEASCSTQKNWQAHYLKLRPAVLPFEKTNGLLIRREKNVYRRWWLQRYSVDQIFELARTLDYTTAEGILT